MRTMWMYSIVHDTNIPRDELQINLQLNVVSLKERKCENIANQGSE